MAKIITDNVVLKTLITMNFLLVLCALLGFVAAKEEKTVVEYLRDNNYTVLSKLLVDAGLTSTLSSSGPFTVLAPTDLAFGKIGQNELNSLQNSLSQLKRVLEYHVISGFILVPMIKGTVSRTTIEGQDVAITAVAGQPLLFNNNSRLVGNGDEVCNNGVVQPIDTVLLPQVEDHLTISQILLQRDDQFKNLFLVFLLADLTHLLETGDITLFAPIDSAFAVYGDNLLRPGGPNTTYIYGEVLKYHIVPGGRTSGLLQQGPVFTVHGASIKIIKTATGVKVNQANVIEADIVASNGVIHVIDSLLIPPEFINNGRG